MFSLPITLDEQVCFPLKATYVTDVPGNNEQFYFKITLC